MAYQDIFNPKASPHLVILGSGATMAAIPDGDRNGRKSSVMDDFISNLNLTDCLKDIKLETTSRNLEDIYSELADRTDCVHIRSELEDRIRNYFIELRLPDKPSVYDFLILSLRKKDAIASFNWDPLLLEAHSRIKYLSDEVPELLFLHGNVNAGICLKDKRYGLLNNYCPICKNKFELK